MKVSYAVLLTAVAIAASVAVVNAAALQDKGKPPQAAGGQGGMPPTPKPVKEHEQLKSRVGTWDVTMKMMNMPPGGPGDTKGTSVMKTCGDFWVVEDFTAMFMGQPFSGHGVTGYDPDKKKWVATWIDSMTDHLTVMEGTSEGNKIIYVYDASSESGGGMTKHRLVCDCKDNDHVALSFFETGADGKEKQNMQIDYVRRKQ
jgi:hypothetical protein